MISKTDLAAAIAHAQTGRWREAHEIVQQDEKGELACWIHAVLHRQEGDLPNAQYWYMRCGRRLRKSLTPEEELREIDFALGGR